MPMPRQCLIIPKKLWHIGDKRFLRIDELVALEEKLHWKFFYKESSFTELQIEVINNTSEEILEALLEMNSRLDGTWNGPNWKISRFLSSKNTGFQTEAFLSSYFVENNKEIFDLTTTQ